MQLQPLLLSEASLHGNVELKSAVGTLPERLTIEKLISIHSYTSGYDGMLMPYYHGGYLWMTRGYAGSNPTVRKINPDTMEILDEIYHPGLAGDEHAIIGADDNYLYIQPEKGDKLFKVRKSDLGIETLHTFDITYGSFGCYYNGKIYKHIYYSDGGNKGKIEVIDCATMTKDTEFGNGVVYPYCRSIITDDAENFWQFGSTSLHHYEKTPNTDTPTYYGGYQFSLNDANPSSYPTNLGIDNDYLYVQGFNFLHKIAKADGSIVERIDYLTKVGDYNVGVITYYMPSFFVRNDTYQWMAMFTNSDAYIGLILRIRYADNVFENSYCEWDVSSIPSITKIIVHGGFHKGYNNTYVETNAEQIKVEYYKDGGWNEYDIDTMPLLSGTIEKVKVGLKNEYLTDDRFPYISYIAVVSEPLPDVGVRTFKILDTTVETEVIKL